MKFERRNGCGIRSARINVDLAVSCDHTFDHSSSDATAVRTPSSYSMPESQSITVTDGTMSPMNVFQTQYDTVSAVRSHAAFKRLADMNPNALSNS